MTPLLIVHDAAIDGDAALVVTGDRDRRVIVWKLATAAKLAEVFVDAPVTAVGCRNGNLAIGDERGRIYLGRVSL